MLNFLKCEGEKVIHRNNDDAIYAPRRDWVTGQRNQNRSNQSGIGWLSE